MKLVIDSSLLIARFLSDEPLHEQAKAFMLEHRTNALCAPRLFRSEVSAVLRKAVYTNRIGYEDGLALLNQILASPIVYFEDDDLIREAYKLANQFRQPRAYDSQYLALAQRFQCDFWTTDEALVNSIERDFQQIKWLGSFTASD